MNCLDLFSGVGMFSYGMQQAGFNISAGCEIDPWCRRVYATHFDVPIYEDVREVTLERLKKDGVISIRSIDVIVGGFPCQPYSAASAGKQSGEKHDSYLWPEMLRVIREIRPRYVLAENVYGFINMGLDELVSDMENKGYTCWPFVIPACAVGYDHRRNRVWILAHTNSNSEPSRTINAKASKLSECRSQSSGVGKENGFARRLDRRRLKALGNGLVWQIPYYIGKAIMDWDVCPT